MSFVHLREVLRDGFLRSKWHQRAWIALLSFLIELHEHALIPRPTFTTEQVRSWAEARGLPPPPDARAWGGLVVKAWRHGLILHSGFRPIASQHTTRKHAKVNVWRTAA